MRTYTVGDVKVVFKPTTVFGSPAMVDVASTVAQLPPQIWSPTVETGQYLRDCLVSRRERDHRVGLNSQELDRSMVVHASSGSQCGRRQRGDSGRAAERRSRIFSRRPSRRSGVVGAELVQVTFECSLRRSVLSLEHTALAWADCARRSADIGIDFALGRESTPYGAHRCRLGGLELCACIHARVAIA